MRHGQPSCWSMAIPNSEVWHGVGSTLNGAACNRGHRQLALPSENFTMWKKILGRKNPGLRSTTAFLMMKDSVSHHEIS
ncbi:hypothetical protein CBM2623_A170171 [Cupriavidus taiwanensis]|nr:hypothetical protein CBM2623_A170171 [Cupriavidus taiwanensis]